MIINVLVNNQIIIRVKTCTNKKSFCIFTLYLVINTIKNYKMKESTLKLKTRNGNVIVKCKIKEPSKIYKFNWLDDVTFDYEGFSFELEDNPSRGLVGKCIENQNGKTVVTWVKVCPKSEVFKHLKLNNQNNSKSQGEYGSIEWWVNGMIGE